MTPTHSCPKRNTGRNLVSHGSPKPWQLLKRQCPIGSSARVSLPSAIISIPITKPEFSAGEHGASHNSMAGTCEQDGAGAQCGNKYRLKTEQRQFSCLRSLRVKRGARSRGQDDC